MSWAIIADSSCNLRSFEPTAPDTTFYTAPLTINVGDCEFIDDDEFDAAAMERALSESIEASSSSCPSMGTWAELFRRADNVIAITISSNLSASYESAFMARNIVMDEYAREHNGIIADKNIFVLDSKAAGGKLEVIVELLDAYLASEHPSFDDAVRYVVRLERSSNVLFSLSSYDNLLRGGRMSKVAGTLAGRMNVRALGKASPQGTIKIVGMTRGERGMLKKITGAMEEFGYEGGLVCIDHVGNEMGASHVADAIRAKWPGANIRIMPCGALCSYYAERSGIIIGFEWLTA